MKKLIVAIAATFAIAIPNLLAMTHSANAEAYDRYFYDQPKVSEIECLAMNIYFESRNQSRMGQIAVAHVVLNRMKDQRYPDTMCGVIHQSKRNASGAPKLNQCQFSWYCDGLPDIPRNNAKWKEMMQVAYDALMYRRNGIDAAHGATHYHATSVNPRWSNTLDRVMRIDDHIFYR